LNKMVRLLEADLYQEKYQEFKELGKGAFGVVLQVQDRDDGKSYAAKHMKIKKQEQKDQVLEEVRILQKLTHPKIISFNGAYEKKGKIILVTEYLNGGELFERIVSDDFSLTEADCAEFMKQILQGVQYLHRNDIVHLDLKPENVICVNQDSMDIKIIDFGLARTVFPGSQMRMMCGTPEYVAPEIVSYENISSATDMWALGVVCYILISGFSPFEGDTDAETYLNISIGEYDFDEPEFDLISQNAKDFIGGLLQKAPRKRLNADQSLSHDWLVQKKSQAVIETYNLKKFLNKRRWKKAINFGVAIRKMSGLGKNL